MKFPIVVGANGHVAAIDRQTGAEIWRTNVAENAGPGGTMDVVVDADRVFVGTNGILLCLELKTGRELWRSEIKGMDAIVFASVLRKPRVHWFAWVCWLGVVIWVCTVFWISSRGGPELEEDFPFIMEAWDKFLHFSAFF